MRAVAVKLSRTSYEYAQNLIKAGHSVRDERDDWSEHQPSADEENKFIEEHGIAEYARWHLGIDDEKDESTKGRYEFPYGDFRDVHRCALLSAESRAGQYGHKDIELAAAHLHGMIDQGS
ncbi:MAG: hypothetical protein JWL67_2072 [Solirubrobacterales bacterium]|jgi:hypothetical protein|nr:hypothetical protein [Solirubrobacterales bacterium]